MLSSDAEFSEEPNNPMAVVLGVNSSKVVLHWNYSLPVEATMNDMSIKRYKRIPPTQETSLVDANHNRRKSMHHSVLVVLSC